MVGRLLALATGRRVLVSLVLLGLGGTVLFRLGPYAGLKVVAGNRPLPEESTTALPELGSFLSGLGSSGRELYASFQLWDFLNPLLVAVAGTLLLGWLVQHAGLTRRIWRYSVLLAPFAALADALENLLLRAAIVAYPAPAPLAPVLETTTKLKLAALMVLVPVAIGMGLVALVRRVRGTAPA